MFIVWCIFCSEISISILAQANFFCFNERQYSIVSDRKGLLMSGNFQQKGVLVEGGGSC